MEILTLLLAFGLVSSEKLDRTYLPPPGSKYSGGSPGELEVPLEFPKETFTTAAPIPSRQKELISPGDTRLTVGSDRIGPRISEQTGDLSPLLPATNSPFNSYQNIYKVPTTTTSYAFTQTTTFPTPDGFETTISPPGTGFLDGSINELPGFNFPINQGQVFNQQTGNQVRPDLIQPLNHIGQRPGIFPTSEANFPISQSQFIPGGQTVNSNPTYNPNLNQYQQVLPSSTISPIPGKILEPVFDSQQSQGYINHLGVQPPGEFIQYGIPSITAAPGYQSGAPPQYSNFDQGNKFPSSAEQGYPSGIPSQYKNSFGYIPGTPDINIPQQTSQRPLQILENVSIPTTGPQKTQHINNFNKNHEDTFSSNIPQEVGNQNLQFINQQGPVPSTFGPQVTVDKQVPSQPGFSEYGGDLNAIKGTFLPGSFVAPTQSSHSPLLVGQQPFVPSSVSSQETPGLSKNSQFVGQQFLPSTNRPQNSQLAGQQVYPTSSPYRSNNLLQQDGQQPQLINQQGDLPSTAVPKGFLSNYAPGITQANSNLPQTGFLSQPMQISGGLSSNQYTIPNVSLNGTQITNGRLPSQQLLSSIPVNAQNMYGPGSTVPSFIPLGNNQTFSNPISFPSSLMPGSSYSSSTINQGGVPFMNNLQRPERPQAESDRNAVILNYDNVLTPEGFAYSFDTSNGIHADQNGTAVGGVKADGSYSYIGDDGRFYKVVYTADENGFQPQGDHLPTPPPIPEAIQRVIEQAAKDKEAGISHDGFYDEIKYGHKKYQRPKNFRPQTKDRTIAYGADIPDENEKNFKRLNNNSEFSSHDGKKPITSTKDDYSNEHKQMYEVDKAKDKYIMRKLSKGQIPSLSMNKISEKNTYEKDRGSKYETVNNQNFDESRTPTGVQPDDANQSIPRKKGSSRHPIVFYDMNSPIVFKDRYNINKEDKLQQMYNDEIKPGQNINQENKLPSKTGDTKYTGSEKDSQNVPRHFEMQKSPVSKRPQQSLRPGLGTLYTDDNINYKPTQSFERDGQTLKEPLKTYDTKYSVSDDYYEELESPGQGEQRLRGFEKPGFTDTNYPALGKSSDDQYEESDLPSQDQQTPISSKKVVFTNTRNKQTSQQRPSLTFRDENSNFDKSDDLSFGGHSRPSYNQQTKAINIKHPSKLDNDKGYQYLPPQDNYNYKINKFPSRLPEISREPAARQPSIKYGSVDLQTTLRPFITPNVYDNDNVSYEEESEELSMGKPTKTFTKVTQTLTTPENEFQTTDDSSEYFDTEIDSYKMIGNDKPTSTTRPGKPELKSFSRRPPYETQESTKTYNNGQNSPSPHEQDRVPQKDFLRPSQKGSRYPLDSYRKTNPVQKSSKTPGYNVVSSTTPTPFIDYSDVGKHPQHSNQTNRVPTTYETLSEDGFSEENSTDDFFTTSDRPGSTKIPPSRPTLSPRVNYSGKTGIHDSAIRPGTTRLYSSAPSRTEEHSTTSLGPGSNIQSSRPTSSSYNGYTTQNQPGYVDFIPTSSTVPGTDGYPDRTISESVTTPELAFGLPGIKNQPSSTYRPNYSLDISPPSLTVDGFGRPISQFEQGNAEIPGSTPTQETGLPSTAAYQDSGEFRPNQFAPNVNAFKPTETRFGQENKILRPGQQPKEFGATRTTVPIHLESHPSSTERVIGENFSGPKQRERFDPKTGYYY